MADDVKMALVQQQDVLVMAEAFNLLVQGKYDGVRGADLGKAASVVANLQALIERVNAELEGDANETE